MGGQGWRKRGGGELVLAMRLECGRVGSNFIVFFEGYGDNGNKHQHWHTEQGKKLVQMLPRKRVGQAKDLDAVLVMLCSDHSHFINGAVISAADGFGV